jgi:two-component system sensor histidine kinase KdpD
MEISKASGQLNRLLENLSNVSHLDTGEIKPHLNWCNINDLFNRVMDYLKDELQPYRSERVVPASMPLVMLDFELMEQALYNLVYNSCKYSNPGTAIRVKAFYDEGYLVIQEMDRGPGFPSDALPFIFNRFYKVHNQTSRGLGIGLSITKGLVELHKGTIQAENRQHGGIRFTIKIPTEISYENKAETKQ